MAFTLWCNSILITLASTVGPGSNLAELASLPLYLTEFLGIISVGDEQKYRYYSRMKKKSDYAPTLKTLSNCLVRLITSFDRRLVKFCGWRVL